jgi:serine/threonine protein kinase
MVKYIIHYFLSLYKLQLGVERRASHHIDPISPVSNGDSTYELNVKSGGKWASRRMTIAPLGEDSGSKSKCFKVIYDDVLVVKIPPVPITDFDAYIQQIRAERLIADQLFPHIMCIAPGVSAVLKKIPSFSSISETDAKRCEELCVSRLRTSPGFQEYLKIGEGFAFFMDLSKYSFLSSVITQMHDAKDKVREEIMSHLDILGDPMSFESVYGKENAALFFNVDTLYAECDEQMTQLIATHGLSSSVPPYKKKEWYLRRINDMDVEKSRENLSETFIENLKALLDDFVLHNTSLISDYKHIVETHVHRKIFNQNISQLSGIAANILKLLAGLRKKGIAIRDLKPDNVFIVGDLSASPLFLAKPQKYSIGLIDFETSVSFKGTIIQPLLGGTPSYATPSHLFKNDILLDVFGNLPHILHLQDWYAIIAMMYKTIIGERLFEQTTKLIPEIIRAAKKAAKNGESLIEVFKQGSQIFWKEARKEFEERIAKHEEMLKAVKIMLTDDVRDMLKIELLEERADIAAMMRDRIQSQKLFTSPKSREDLMKSPYSAIAKVASNWIRGVNVPSARPEIRARVIRFLRGLEDLKLKSEQKLCLIKALEHENTTTLSSHTLSEVMFSVVMNAMYPPDWKVSESRTPFFSTDDITDEKSLSKEETIAVERTIVYEQ